jgi:hypothetical protein
MSDVAPIFCPKLFNVFSKQLVLFFAPRSLNHGRIQDFLPSVQALNIRAHIQVRCNFFPIFSSILLNKLSEFLIFFCIPISFCVRSLHRISIELTDFITSIAGLILIILVVHILIVTAGPIIHLLIHVFFIVCHILTLWIINVLVLIWKILIIRVDFSIILFINLTILIIYLFIIINFMRIIILLNITVLPAVLLFWDLTFQGQSIIFLFRSCVRIMVHNYLRLGTTLFCRAVELRLIFHYVLLFSINLIIPHFFIILNIQIVDSVRWSWFSLFIYVKIK